jgi:hypothetical protein
VVWTSYLANVHVPATEFLLNYVGNLDVTVQQVTLLFHIQEILGSNFNLKITCLEGFVVFPSSSRLMPEQYLKVDHDHFLPHPFQFIIH